MIHTQSTLLFEFDCHIISFDIVIMTKRFMTALGNMNKIQKRLGEFSNLVPNDDRWINMQQQVAELHQIMSDGLKDVTRMHEVIFDLTFN